MKDILNEIEIMKMCNLNDNNINSVKFYEYFDTENEFVIVMELCDNNLKNILKEKKEGFNENEIKDIIRQLNNTFKIMAKNNIIHRALNLENILIKYINEKKSKFIVKLSDYSYSVKLITPNQKCNDFCGDFNYLAPEVLKGEEYDNKCDLWSLGIIIYELYFSKKPFTGQDPGTLLNDILENDNNNLKITSDIILDDLIEKLLTIDPKKRIGWEDYFNHPFFDNEFAKQIHSGNIDFRKKYIDLKEIGKGAFCFVYKGKIINSNEYRALKIFNKNDIRKNAPINVNLEVYLNKFMKSILNEIIIMRMCNSNDNNINSVKFYECYDTENEFVIVMELCDNDLKTILKEKNSFNKDEIKEILQELNNTFKIMINNKIIHRDLKLENILVKYINEKKNKLNKFIVKLSDFGVSRKLNTLTQNCTTHTGTIIYMAPEILNEEEYNNKCDLWSLGIIIYQLFFKNSPYNANTEVGLLKNINKFGKALIAKTKFDLLDDLINKLLEKEPSKRLYWEEYFEHPFIKGNTK